MNTTLLTSRLLACCAFIMAATAASAQGAYPMRPVRYVVPYPPGGSTDPIARLIGVHLGTIWGQQVVVENRAGGDTIIGTGIVAKAPPDGYTLR